MYLGHKYEQVSSFHSRTRTDSTLIARSSSLNADRVRFPRWSILTRDYSKRKRIEFPVKATPRSPERSRGTKGLRGLGFPTKKRQQIAIHDRLERVERRDECGCHWIAAQAQNQGRTFLGIGMFNLLSRSPFLAIFFTFFNFVLVSPYFCSNLTLFVRYCNKI